LAIKFQEMEEKLLKEKEEKEKTMTTTDVKDEENEVDELIRASEGVKTSSSSTLSPVISTTTEQPHLPPVAYDEEKIHYTPGPIRVPTVEPDVENLVTISDLPPVPQTIVEQERLDLIEINNDGTSGHLSHSIQ
jgi:hypothetical protein